MTMGQYHYTVNLSKREFLNPHKLGDGLKLAEQAGGGTMTALMILLAASAGKGGGDVVDRRESELVGSWAGDLVAVIGDYTEDGDLPHYVIPASLIYQVCGYSAGEPEPVYEPDRAHWEGYAEVYAGWHRAWEIAQQAPFRDITDDVVPLVEQMLGVRITGDGWRDREEIHYVQGSKAGTVYEVTRSSCTCPDHTIRHRPCKHMQQIAS